MPDPSGMTRSLTRTSKGDDVPSTRFASATRETTEQSYPARLKRTSSISRRPDSSSTIRTFAAMRGEPSGETRTTFGGVTWRARRTHGDALVWDEEGASVRDRGLDVRRFGDEVFYLANEGRLAVSTNVKRELVPFGYVEALLSFFHAGRSFQNLEQVVARHAPHRRCDAHARQAVLLLVPLLALFAGCATGPLPRARRAMDEGAFELAARNYREALVNDGSNADVWMELAGAEMGAERYERAREAFEHAATLRPDDPAPRMRIGNTWELQRRWDEARTAYEQATVIAPNNARTHRMLGTRLLRWGEYSDAIAPLQRAAALEPSSLETWRALALAQYNATRVEDAERTFRHALEIGPHDRSLRLSYAALLINARRHTDALAMYDAVVADDPEFAPAHVGRAILLETLGEVPRADAAYRDAIRASDESPEYLERYRSFRSRHSH